jgi:YVTN family beta-propeller protein
MHLSKYILLVVGLGILVSCKKEPIEESPNTPVDYFKNGLLVVNEGLFQQNNSTLSWVDLSNDAVNNEVFEQKTNRQLGDVGNDIIRYGSKIYIVVNVSSTIEILDAKSGTSIKQIQMTHNGIPKQPRFAAKTNGKLFVSCFDGYVDVIDTASMEVTQRIQVGANPDEIHFANNLLYVANSGGLSYPNVDSTLSVIDPNTLTEINRIVVGKNPTRVSSDNNGNIYVITQTGFNTLNSQLVKVNPQTLTVASVFPWQVMRMTPMNNHMILYISNNNVSSIQLMDTQSGTITNPNFLDAGLFTTYYGAQYDAARNQLYCFDAMSYVNKGYIRIFSSTGNFIKNIQVGLNPSKLLIYE